ncbi:ATP-binding cassette domain-containing protein [Marinimicrobium sp. C6131]|uniref:ABC transporter ATP-binding protein n=1 Tax=Marinimicrobium sp. C6131 TaxID=3022676 RepID=UPI00223E6730|nr:ATP-binding cassette domain-containing protein [Marinimicrobium sp. C6131]UZJ45689.1 ATP-binding cassette domain-containing protein [Marinimicrobium sp. C6131]
MIHTEALVKSFPSKDRKKTPVEALVDVSFDARDGEITGLLGPNGAGKSTTLRILAGLVKPDRGLACVDGHDVVKEPLAVRRRLGFLPHNAGLYPRLTSRENLVYYGQLCGLDAGEAHQRADELIERLEMESFADRRAEGFSQGQRTRVALGRALIHNPGTLILDEPTNGLDVMATRNLRTILRGLRDEGHCVLISSHIMQEVSRLCDRVAIISEGRIAMTDSVTGILEKTGQNDLEDAFVAAIGERPEVQG